MGLDVMIHLVKGYKIPLSNIEEENNSKVFKCNCNANYNKFCPSCGTEVGTRTIYRTTQLLKNLPEEHNWRDLEPKEFYFNGVISNCDLEDGEKYVILGIQVLEMENIHDTALKEVKDIPKEEIGKKIKAFVEKHEINLKGSKFGLFYVQSCW